MAISLANSVPFQERKYAESNAISLRHSESELFLTNSYVTDLSELKVNKDGHKAICFDKGG
jgi:hypothetical protein